MILVVDSSVAVKLIVNEPGHEAAQGALAREGEWIAPDWLMIEIASALAQKVRLEGLAINQARRAYAAMSAFINRFVASEPMLLDAFALSVRLNHALYECLYLALAVREKATLLTADGKFVRTLKGRAEAALVELLA